MEMIMEQVIKRYLNLLRVTQLSFVRDMMQRINWNDRLIAVRGQRGVGKTTLMLQRIKKEFGDHDAQSVIYASLDNIYFATHNLLEFIEQFYQYGGKYVFLDEVHKYPNWSREIKNAYDEFPDLHIVFTGSSLINILNAEADLSRRCITYDMQGLSFREYLLMFKGQSFPVASLEDVCERPNEICSEVAKRIRPLQYFQDYLHKGYYPFLVEGEETYYIRIENMVNLTIDTELPQLRQLDVANVRKIKALLEVLASGLPMQVDATKLSKMAEISRNTLLQYLQHLDAARIIRLLYLDSLSVKRLQKPDKIYLDNPNMHYALSANDVNIGTIRETFFVNQLSYAHGVEYANGAADFTVDHDATFEIGGRSKDGKQLACVARSFIAADDEEYAFGNKIPLWLFGFLY